MAYLPVQGQTASEIPTEYDSILIHNTGGGSDHWKWRGMEWGEHGGQSVLNNTVKAIGPGWEMITIVLYTPSQGNCQIAMKG